MLGKLIKHEFRATAPMMLLCNGILLLLSVIAGIYIAYVNDIYYNLSDGFYSSLGIFVIFAVAGILVVAFISRYYFFYRYYKNYFTDEGYLMLTLPVKSEELIISKMVVGFLWQLIVVVVTAVCALSLICGFSYNTLSINDILKLAFEIGEAYSDNKGVIFLFIICGILSYIIMLLGQYLAVSIGQLANKNKLRYSILVLVLMFIIRTIANSFLEFGVSTTSMINMMNSSFYGYSFYDKVTTGMVIEVVILIAVAVVLFFADKYFLDHKVNVE